MVSPDLRVGWRSFRRLRPDAKDRVTLRSANTEITVNPGLGAALSAGKPVRRGSRLSGLKSIMETLPAVATNSLRRSRKTKRCTVVENGALNRFLFEICLTVRR